MAIAHTRAMVTAALNGDLDNVEYKTDPFFGLEIPKSCPNVPSEELSPRDTWSDPAAYDTQAKKLAGMFKENFRQFSGQVPEVVEAAGPKV